MDGDGEDHADFYTAKNGIALLEKNKDQPFFIGVGFMKPHSPPTAPKRFFDLTIRRRSSCRRISRARPAAPAGFPAASIPARNGDLFINRDATPEEARK